MELGAQELAYHHVDEEWWSTNWQTNTSTDYNDGHYKRSSSSGWHDNRAATNDWYDYGRPSTMQGAYGTVQGTYDGGADYEEDPRHRMELAAREREWSNNAD